MNADGLADMIVGAPTKLPDAAPNGLSGVYPGAAYVVLGPVSGHADLASASAEFMGEARTTDQASHAVSSAGDGDGLDDIVIGEWGAMTGGRGAAYVLSGARF